MSQPTAHGAMAGVGFAAVGLGFALLGDVWLGVSLVVVSVVLLAGALDPLVTGDLGDAFGFAMMGAGVGVVVGGAISRTSQVWVGITTLTGGVVTGAGAFVLVLRGNGLGVVGFVLPVALVGVAVAMLSVSIAVAVSGAMIRSTRASRQTPCRAPSGKCRDAQDFQISIADAARYGGPRTRLHRRAFICEYRVARSGSMSRPAALEGRRRGGDRHENARLDCG